MDNEKRMAGDYEIIHAIHIGDREVVFGVDEKNEFDLHYMCGYCMSNELFTQYEENMVSVDYIEIMKLFCDRVNKQIEAVRAEQEKVIVPMELITAEQCYPNDYKTSIDGKVIAIKPSYLRAEYRTADRQIWFVTGGFGAAANSRGRAVYAINLYNGDDSRWNREDVLGEIKPEYLPEWSKERLEIVRSGREKSEQTRNGQGAR